MENICVSYILLNTNNEDFRTIPKYEKYKMYQKLSNALVIRYTGGEYQTLEARLLKSCNEICSKKWLSIILGLCHILHYYHILCKYINKDSDQAIFNLRNEVQVYEAGSYVSSNEASWRLLSFPLHERYASLNLFGKC